jgi:hypothetical protein
MGRQGEAATMSKFGNAWRRLPLGAKIAAIVVPGVTLGVAAGYLRERRRTFLPGLGWSPAWPLPGITDLLDYVDEPDEEEPADIQYADDTGPCVPPPQPWDVPVAAGFEGDEGFCVPESDLEPIKKTEVTFAAGANRPRWPIQTTDKRKLQVSYQDVRKLWHGRWGRHFGASRKGKKGPRIHAGVDLFADPGDVVLAVEDGEILAALPFYEGTGAVYQKTDSGIVINYGEIERGSWTEFGIPNGIETGHRVKVGDPIGRIGLSDTGSHMLHIETYASDVTLDEIRGGDLQWPAGTEPPVHLLDPTRYLVRAQRVHAEEMA